MKERTLLNLARLLSAIFSPVYMTFAIFACVMIQNYMMYVSVGHVHPIGGYVVLLLIVFAFTVLIPVVSFSLYRRMARMTRMEAGFRRNRNIAYVMFVLSYLACTIMLFVMNVPMFLTYILVASLCTLVVCAVLNMWFKVSVHMAALGGITAVVGVYGFLMHFNPLYYICLLFLLSGVVGSCRMVLRQNTMSQVIVGYVVGLCFTSYFVLKGYGAFLLI